MRSEWRVACVRIPRFTIGALWQRTRSGMPQARQLALPLADVPTTAAPREPREPHWDERPVAVVDHQRLRAVTAAAGQRRVRAGMSIAEARACCADLELLDWDEPVVAQTITRATAALVLASPQVTPVAGAPGMWWVGAGGLDGIGGERGLVRTLWRVATLWHPRPRIAVADSCVVARAATWAGGEAGEEALVVREADGTSVGVLVPRDGCAAYLARVPLTLLPLADDLRETLVALGVRTAGALAALDPGDMERRWGADGLIAWRLARGDDPRRPVLATLEASREAAAELATPATTLEPVLFLVRAALERLTAALTAEGRAAAALAITLTLDDGRGALPAGGRPHTVTREVRLPRPIGRAAPLFERCRALLERFTLTAPVAGVRVSVTATAPAAGAQGNLLDARWRDPGAAEAAFDRLRAELGPNVVVRAAACDAHRPEGRGRWVPVEDADVAAPDAPPSNASSGTRASGDATRD